MELIMWIAKFIAEMGGISAIVIFALKRLIEIKMDRMSKDYELCMSKELEKYTNELDNKSHKFKILFDKKITAYNEVLKSLIPCFENIKQIMPNEAYGIDCNIEICELDSQIAELKNSIENNIIMLDEDIIRELKNIINCLKSQILAYRSITSESDNDEMEFSISLDELKNMEMEAINMFRSRCNNLEVMS